MLELGGQIVEICLECVICHTTNMLTPSTKMLKCANIAMAFAAPQPIRGWARFREWTVNSYVDRRSWQIILSNQI